MLQHGFNRNRQLWSVTTGISGTPFWSWIQGYTTLISGNTAAHRAEKTTFTTFINSNYEVI